MPARPITHVRPAFQKNAPLAILYDSEPALEPDKIIPRLRFALRNLLKPFGPLPRPAHGLLAAQRRVIHSAFNFHAHNLNRRFRSQQIRHSVHGLAHCRKFRFSGASDGDD